MKRLIGFAGPVVSMFAMVLAAVPAFAQDVTFVYKFEPGSSERHGVKLNQEVTMGQMVLSNFADFEVTLKCVSGADGKYAMQMTFDKADISTTMFGNTSPNPIAEQMVGQSVAFTIDAAGEVTDVAPVGVFDAWATAQQMVEPVLRGWYPHLPGSAVAVGGEWKKAGVKETQASGAEALTNATYKFKAMKKEKGRDVAVVEQTLDTTLGGTSATPMGTYTIAGTGAGKTEFLYDPAKSRVAKLKGKIDLNMDMTPQAGGDMVEAVITNHLERDLLE